MIWTFRGKWEINSRHKGGSKHVVFLNREVLSECGATGRGGDHSNQEAAVQLRTF